MHASSITPFAFDLLVGPRRTGVGLGHGYVLVDDRVLALTPPGRLRMPNGVETELVIANGECVSVGGGALETDTASVEPGPLWNPRPRPQVTLSLRPQPRLELEQLAGRGPGLTPLGDDILIGYLAASALSGVDKARRIALADRAVARTNALSGTLLRLAACGALPEAAHRLLVDGDPQPLLRFGASSGRGLAFGLGWFGGNRAHTTHETRIGLGSFELAIAPTAWAAAPTAVSHA